MQFIDLKKQYQYIKQDVLKEINEVLDSGQYIMGKKVEELETVLSGYVGAKHCVGVADGTGRRGQRRSANHTFAGAG